MFYVESKKKFYNDLYPFENFKVIDKKIDKARYF